MYINEKLSKYNKYEKLCLLFYRTESLSTLRFKSMRKLSDTLKRKALQGTIES